MKHINEALAQTKWGLPPDHPLSPLLVAQRLVGFCLKLPSLTQKTFGLSPRAASLRNALKVASDPIELLFTQLPAIYADLKQSSQSLSEDITEIMSFYSNNLRKIEDLLFRSLQFNPQQGIKSLQQRASNIKGLGRDDRQKQFIIKLANYTNELNSIEEVITLCCERYNKSWTDGDIEHTKTLIPELAMEFRKTECLAGFHGRDVKRSFFSITTSTPEQGDIQEVIELSEQEFKSVEEIAQSLESKLRELSYKQVLGVLAQLASRLKPIPTVTQDSQSQEVAAAPDAQESTAAPEAQTSQELKREDKSDL